ncbi:phage tail protein, partial [Clostridium tyrobutyricum]|nr:phage tail protein [Clostridium tyrobutyricum]
VQADHTALADWSKVQEESKKFYNAICFNLSAPIDSRHVINLTNPKVAFKDARGEQTGDKYIPSLLGYIAGRDASSQSPTFMVLDNLASVT